MGGVVFLKRLRPQRMLQIMLQQSARLGTHLSLTSPPAAALSERCGSTKSRDRAKYNMAALVNKICSSLFISIDPLQNLHCYFSLWLLNVEFIFTKKMYMSGLLQPFYIYILFIFYIHALFMHGNTFILPA